MKKIIDYLKRFYQCIYDYTLYRKFFKEPMVLAVLFILPMFLLFTLQAFNGNMQTPRFVEESFDPYYNLISSTTYEEIIEFKPLEDDEVSPWTVEPTGPINIEFEDGIISLEQEGLLDKTVTSNNLTYRLIMDTNNTLEIDFLNTSKYSDDISDQLGFGDDDMIVYVTDSFAILSMRGVTNSFEFTNLTGSYLSTDSIYLFLKANYVSYKIILPASFIMSLFLFSIYYIVAIIIIRSILKREQFTLSKSRKTKIALYSMQPGVYVHFIGVLVMSQSKIAVELVIPLLSMLTIVYIVTKSLVQVKDYVHKEDKAEKRLKQKR